MRRSVLFCIAGVLLSSMLIGCPLGAGRAQSPPVRLKLPRVVISSGGPYVSSNSNAMQQFGDAVNVPARYAAQPLSLVFTNGSERTAEYQWVRVFLLPGGADASVQSGAQPSGRLLIDENSFLSTPQVYLDMTDQLVSGLNKIAIEGAGTRGASFQWELRSIAAPEVTAGRPEVYAGSTFVLYGSGFSLRPEENLVQMGDGELPVLQSNFSELLLKVPAGWPAGTYDLTVALQNYRSQKISVVVVKPPSRN